MATWVAQEGQGRNTVVSDGLPVKALECKESVGYWLALESFPHKSSSLNKGGTASSSSFKDEELFLIPLVYKVSCVEV